MKKTLHAVTGAYGYSGKYIAKRLLNKGAQVITLTNSPDRPNPFGDKVKAFRYNFDKPEKLTESLKDVSVLYNTYWVRFNHKTFKHSIAVDNSEILFRAAKDAGVERIVHISITNPSEDSDLEYFQGKAILENMLKETGIPHSILRPAILFGKEDILINNIAWMLRHFPVMGVFGDGKYKVQPINVDDLAKLAVEEGTIREENKIIQAIGPETFEYKEMVKTIGSLIGKNRPVIPVPDMFGYIMGWLVGKIKGDKMVTREEIKGLKSNLLYVDAQPAGTTRLTEWVKQNASTLGVSYANEVKRRKNRVNAYEEM